jgi:hypothetical protein
MTRRERRMVRYVLAALCAGCVTAAENDAPDVGFLEYLGSLVRDDENWIGPDDMTVAPVEERKHVVTDTAGESDHAAEEFQ